MKQCKKSKVVKPKETKKREIEKSVVRLSTEDIQRIVEGLKRAIEEEHSPVVSRVYQLINTHKRIQQEYFEHFTELCQVLKVARIMTSLCRVNPVHIYTPKNLARPSL